MTNTTTNRADVPAKENQNQVESPKAGPVYRPAVDIFQTEDAVLLYADMPGVDESGVDLTLERNQLTIRGSVHPVDLPGQRLTYAEYGVGDFERTFTLSDEIDRSAIEASIKDGVLQVRLPKSKEAATRKITVKAG